MLLNREYKKSEQIIFNGSSRLKSTVTKIKKPSLNRMFWQQKKELAKLNMGP